MNNNQSTPPTENRKRRYSRPSFAARMQPHELVDMWSSFSDAEKRRRFRALKPKKRVALLTNLPSHEQETILNIIPLTNMAELLTEISPDDLVDIMQAVSSEVRAKVWKSLPPKIQEETRLLLRYDQEEAAGIMSSRYFAIRADLTVRQAISFIRSSDSRPETIYYIYVVDHVQRLIGVVSLRQLMSSSDDRRIEQIMITDLVTVNATTDREEAAQLLSSYDLIALPVCDNLGRILGIITFDDVLDVIRQEQTEDIYRMGALGTHNRAYLQSSIFRLVLRRVPWLILLLTIGTITTNLISAFTPLLVGAMFIIWFIPVITQTGGNTGTQSATLIIRGLAIGEIHWRDVWRVILKECAVGLLMGLILSIALLIRSAFLPPMLAPLPALAIALALATVVLLSSLLGALFPLIISRLGLDPTVAAGPLMATVIDFLGITAYFLIVRTMLGV